MGLNNILLTEADINDKITSRAKITFGTLVDAILDSKDGKIDDKNIGEFAKELGVVEKTLSTYVEAAKKNKFLNTDGSVATKYAQERGSSKIAQGVKISQSLNKTAKKFIAPKVTNNNLFAAQTFKMLSIMEGQAASSGIKNSLMLTGDPGVGKCLSGDTEIEIKVDDNLFNFIQLKLENKNKRQVAGLRKNIYDNKFLNIDYWLENEEVETAIEKCKTVRHFIEYFTYDIENIDNWNPTMVKTRCIEIQNQVLTFEYSNKTKLPLFSDKQTQVNFWLFRGWTTDEALHKIFEIQSKNGIKGNKVLSQLIRDEYKKVRNNYIDYYLEKGMSIDEATQSLKEKQATFSKKKLIEQYGEEVGNKKLIHRNNKWITSLKENNDWDALSKLKDSNSFEYCLKKTNGDRSKATELYDEKCKQKDNASLKYFKRICKNDKDAVEQFNALKQKKLLCGYTSKESIEYFDKIVESVSELKEYDLYYGNKNEYYINDGRIYFYDFTIPKLKLIIEYRDIGFHPNPNWDELKWNSWRSVFNKFDADKVFSFDQEKKMIAEKKGFKVIELYSDEIDTIDIISIITQHLLEIQNA